MPKKYVFVFIMENFYRINKQVFIHSYAQSGVSLVAVSSGGKLNF
jgi:hypothetical protein